MAGNLKILAGRNALQMVRDGGLSPEQVDVIAGAAGGPKWLVLNGLDRALFSSWFTSCDNPVFLIGSSIGSWRFAAIAQGMESGAYDRFEETYLKQHYSSRPTASEVTGGTLRMMDAFLDDSGAQAILSHRFFRLSMLAVRCRGLFIRDQRYVLGPAMLIASAANALSRKHLRFFFSRTLFHDPREVPPFFGKNGFPLQKVPLGRRNLADALLASGSIPLVMEGVVNPPGADPGMYRDGGLIDYHLDIPFRNQRLVLFPHYSERVIPGWLDKPLPWRKPDPANLENMVLLCPSQAFIKGLPLGKIPDRDDFARFRGQDEERVACWRKVIQASRALGNEFLDLVHGSGLKRAVEPFPYP